MKEAAKKAGFKYVWHSAGNVLVLRRESDWVHAVRSVLDLSAVLASSGVGLVRVELIRQDPLPVAPSCSARGDGTD